MTACQPGQWHDLFVAMAGAAAALTGLIFAAASVNLEQALKYRAPPRAGRVCRSGGRPFGTVGKLSRGVAGAAPRGP